jgi:hypothetical protein
MMISPSASQRLARLSLIVFVSAIVLSSGRPGSAVITRADGQNRAEPILAVIPHKTPCTNATLKGTYGFQRNGQTSQGPLTAVGLATFDGRGNAVAQQTVSRSGTFNSGTNQVFKYEINPDCTGTQTDAVLGVIAQLVVVHNGAEVLGMSMTPGNNVAIHLEQISDR